MEANYLNALSRCQTERSKRFMEYIWANKEGYDTKSCENELGITTRQQGGLRGSFADQYGMTFERLGKCRYKLVAITLEKSSRYHKNEAHKKSKRTPRVKPSLDFKAMAASVRELNKVFCAG